MIVSAGSDKLRWGLSHQKWILLANSDQATSRANRDVRVAAGGTPATQSEIR